MIKLADMPPAKLMSLYTAYLRALYLIHQNNHWKCRGPNFYGNHLLFERLYEETQKSADTAAEKTIGLYDRLDDMQDFVKTVARKYSPENYGGDCVKAGLEAEKMFLRISKTVYSKLEKRLTLGLDDMLMELASKHEVHVYLLIQASKPEGSLEVTAIDEIPSSLLPKAPEYPTIKPKK